MDDITLAAVNLPWYAKWFLALGGAALIWKAIQGGVPKFLAFLRPLALRLTDGFVALIQTYPILRWFVFGNKDKFLQTANTLIDGLEEILNAVQARLAEDLAGIKEPKEEPKPEPPKP
jgi:hypothetical protein